MADDQVGDFLREADAAFASGDADRWSELFAEDGRVYLLYRPDVPRSATKEHRWRVEDPAADELPLAPHGADLGIVTTFDEVQAAYDRSDHASVLRLTDAILAERPGDDAVHELRARALAALGRLEEAERHANDAVRLDPDEIRYRELLAEVLSRRGAHRDAATEFGRLARDDPRQPEWTVAEARERLGAAQAPLGVEAAERAVRLNPRNGIAQLTLAQAMTRSGDARGALGAAGRAVELMPDNAAAREALADALWLADRDDQALREFRELALQVDGSDRDRIVRKARQLYRQHARGIGSLIAFVKPLFDLAFRRGWLHVRP